MTTTSCAKRCTSIMAGAAILILGTLIVFVWVQFSQGAFRNKQQINVINITTSDSEQEKFRLTTANKTKHKEIIQKSHIGEIGSESNEELVKPLRIYVGSSSEHHNKHDNLILRHHSGHFRHKTTESWERHPHYEIDAFGRKLFLELEYNDKFVDPNLHIVHHSKENHTQKVKHDPRMSGCFYTGKIRGDKGSGAAVSLCHGMTGYIHTSDCTYYIEPVEKYTNGSTNSLIHKMRRVLHPSKNEIPESPEFFENSENQTIIEDDFYVETSFHPKDHSIRKRSIKSQEQWYLGVEGTCDTVDEDIWNQGELSRATRAADTKGTQRINNESFLKVLVVVDKSIVKYHSNDDDLTHYILTLMSHVSFLFRDVTIGNAISVELVQIRVLRHDDFSNTYSQDMLIKFCNWQKQNIRERTHDVSILLTRDAICRNGTNWQNCSTLGVADVNSMCQSGCAIVRDKGLATSYTIAHELGHVLSMPHDEDPKCQHLNKGIRVANIMSRAIKRDAKPFTWSPCSKYFVTEFIESGRASCMWTPPINRIVTYAYTDMLPGDKFNLDKQCELEFGPGFRVCFTNTSCEHLYCTTNDASNDYCHSTFSPWADGTNCGKNSVCFNGACRPEQDFKPVDGGWGPWTEWGQCSRTCGGGIRISPRYCNSPKPVNGGSYCIGENKRFESCNTMDCDPGSIDFRALQCAEFNGNAKDFPNITNNVQWIADHNLHKPEEVCKLFCIPTHITPITRYALKAKVLDGTKCGPTGFGICINGICKSGGCDNKLDSPVVLDDCGICGGDNSRCQEISGTYNNSADSSGYNNVITIPKGSSNLNISQDSYPRIDENYLALVDGETGRSILNGDYVMNTDETHIKFGDVEIRYSGTSSPTEWITSPKNKKLPKDLVVTFLSVGNLTHPNIRWKYVIDIEKAPRSPIYPVENYWASKRSYSWQLYQEEHWSKCNSICDGKQYRRPICVDLVTGTEVPRGYCDNIEDTLTQSRDCNTHCELSWTVHYKSVCSPQCGKGIRQVYYKCMKVYRKKMNFNKIVNEKHCIVLAQPPAIETCTTICNSTRWNYSPWSECSKTCGGGVQRRTAQCVDDNYRPIDESYCNNSEMITEQICNTESCPVWTLAETSSCSRPCGGGFRNLTYYCVLGGRIRNPLACDQSSRPPSSEPCNRVNCGRWTPSEFSPCSVSCGEGTERMQYDCREPIFGGGLLDDEFCWRDKRPPQETRACYKGECDVSSYERRHKMKDVYVNNIIPDTYHRYNTFRWIPGDWTPCSKTCGTGRTLQMFYCRDGTDYENDTMCNPNLRPNNIAECNNVPCPTWEVGDWSPVCDSNCERHRQVRCRDSSGDILNDYQCDGSRKPENGTKCKLSECPHITNTIPKRYFDSKEKEDKRYKWRVGAWKPCSNTCGKGTRRRHIECKDTLNDIPVVDLLCRNVRKPKSTKPCEKYTCKYAWIEGYWSSCSASCGTGIKKRNVTCHSVQRGGIIDPIPLPDLYQNKIHHQHYCSVYNRPPNTAKCLLSHCGDHYFWQPEPWKQCSHKCGKKGRQVRAIHCVSVRTKEKVPRHLCPKSLKPPRKRKCNQWRCLYKNCREIKHYMQTKENKDYVISIRGRPVQIYCYKMDTPEPQEYISLHPDKSNYAEFYDRRLMNITSCPYNGQRKDNCECDQVGPRSGFTKFWKVGINITSMQIIANDFTFSKQLKGTQIEYGSSGDCYSQVEGCAQGRFSVDLTYTSFRLSNSVKWEKLGSFASMFIHRSETMAAGKCGGYCGKCMPDPNIGLAVEIT